MNTLNDAKKVARLVREAGGKIVGRTRLQKIAFLLELSGVGDGFRFSYHHFGPFSEELSSAAETAEIFDMVHEESKKASWGGTYSVYTTNESDMADDKISVTDSPVRTSIINMTNHAGAIALELAATAAYLAATHVDDPWVEVVERKQEKATPDKIREAKELYARLLTVAPKLPAIT